MENIHPLSNTLASVSLLYFRVKPYNVYKCRQPFSLIKGATCHHLFVISYAWVIIYYALVFKPNNNQTTKHALLKYLLL